MQELIRIQTEKAKEEIRCCDQLNSLYGLVLTEEDITRLVAARQEALRSAGRVEFGGGILPQLIRAFCSSPYVDRHNYADTLELLQEAFYYFKSECNDVFSDEELVDFMARVFNGWAAGAPELLTEITLEELCRWARNPDVLYDREEIL